MKYLRITILALAALLMARMIDCKEDQDPARKQYIEGVRLAVESICLAMQPSMERPDKLRSISVQDNPEINAYADDKGNIVFFMGMVDFVRSKDEIAAVCGHEMSHLAAQHIKRSIGTSILATITQEVIGGTLGDIAGNALYSKQSRKHEREADERGLLYMWNAGYDPHAIWKFWMSLENQNASGNSGIEKYFSTHPVTMERVENLKVLLVRHCKMEPQRPFCDEILEDQGMNDLFNAFENR